MEKRMIHHLMHRESLEVLTQEGLVFKVEKDMHLNYKGVRSMGRECESD